MNDQLEFNAVTEAIIGAAIHPIDKAPNQPDSQILRELRASAFKKFDESQ